MISLDVIMMDVKKMAIKLKLVEIGFKYTINDVQPLCKSCNLSNTREMKRYL